MFLFVRQQMADGPVDRGDCINMETDSQPERVTDEQIHRYKTSDNVL